MKPILIFLALIASITFAKDPIDVAKTKALEFASRNEVELRLDQPYAENANPRQRVDLYLPKKRAGNKPLPVIVLIHAGGWRNGDRIDYAATAVQLARSGDFTVVSVGYRLTGEAKWPAQIHDCKAAIRYVRAHAKEWNIDPGRIAAWGSSAGGHLVALLGTSGGVKEFDVGAHLGQSSRVQAVVDLCGPIDLMRFPKSLPVSKLLGGPPQEKASLAALANPITHLSKDAPPFLIQQGDADTTVPPEHSKRLFEALKQAGISVHLHTIHGAGHGGFYEPATVKMRDEFLERLLKRKSGEATPSEATSTESTFTGPNTK